VNKKTHGGLTPLHMAAMHDHTEAMRLLVHTYGADPRIRDHSGRLAEQYLNNAYGTRRLTPAETLQTKTFTPSVFRQGGDAATTSSTKVQRNGALQEPNNRPVPALGDFDRMGSFRRASTMAMNFIRGQSSSVRASGSLPTTPVEKTNGHHRAIRMDSSASVPASPVNKARGDSHE